MIRAKRHSGLPDSFTMTSIQSLQQREHRIRGLDTRSMPGLMTQLRRVNQREARLRARMLDFDLFLKDQQVDCTNHGLACPANASFEFPAPSSAEAIEPIKQLPTYNRAHWHGRIVGCFVFLLVGGMIAVQLRPSVVTALKSGHRLETNVHRGTDNSSTLTQVSLLAAQYEAGALSSLTSGSAQPSTPLSGKIDYAQNSMDWQTALLSIARLWLSEQNRSDRPSIVSTVSGPTPIEQARSRRAILYEEELDGSQERTFIGSVLWRAELAPRTARAPESAVTAEVEIPDRKLHAIWSLRRNTNDNAPASHTIQIVFEIPPEYPLGQVLTIPGVLARRTEQAVGVELKGQTVKVSDGFFRIHLSPVEADRVRNVEILKERPWFDIPVVYSSGRRGLLVIESGGVDYTAFSDFLEQEIHP
jgi:hypothetical protein